MKITVKQLRKLVESTMSDVLKQNTATLDPPPLCPKCEGMPDREGDPMINKKEKCVDCGAEYYDPNEDLGWDDTDNCPECGSDTFHKADPNEPLSHWMVCDDCGYEVENKNANVDDSDEVLSACPECGSEDVDLDATQHSDFNVCNDCGNEY